MKTLCVLILISTFVYGQQPAATRQAESSGTCSPNILSNQGSVQFTCNAAIDQNTATKIVQLLNRVLQKTGDTGGPQLETNRKLDEILDFLQNEAQQEQELSGSVKQLQQQARQRQLTEQEETRLVSLLTPLAPQELYFICAPDPETSHFADQISRALNSAGWKTIMHPYNWGTFERYTEGVQIWVSDVKKPNRTATILQTVLNKVGIHADGLSFGMVEEGKIALYVGTKPTTQ